LRNNGKAPSQIAHAEIHFCRYVSSPGSHKRFATAHVATIIESVSTAKDHEKILKGLTLTSILSTVLLKILAQTPKDCFLIASIKSGPPIPSGNQGKFSISVVVVN